jgi:hypothetical protein
VLWFTSRLTKMVTMGGRFRSSVRRTVLHTVDPLGFFQQFAANLLSGMSLHYRGSPIVKEDGPKPFSAVLELLAGRSQRFRDWLRFRRGLRAGDRALGPVWHEPSVVPHDSVARVFYGTHHTLLVFEGIRQGDRERLWALVERFASRPSEDLAVYYVARTSEHLPEREHVVEDRNLTLHRAFGAEVPTAFVIRPDQYVGYRGQPPDEGQVARFLAGIFTRPPCS